VRPAQTRIEEPPEITERISSGSERAVLASIMITMAKAKATAAVAITAFVRSPTALLIKNLRTS
jgi:hypothetical protein